MTETSREKVIDYAPKQAPEKTPGGTGFGVFMLLLLTWAAMAGGFLYLQKRPMPQPVVQPGKDFSQDIITLREDDAAAMQDLQDLRAEIKQLQDRPREDTASPRIEALEGRIAELQQQVAQEKAAAQGSHAMPLMLAALNLRSRLANAEPYEADLAALKNLVESDAGLAMHLQTIEGLLGQGVPSTAALLEQLKGLERDLVAAAQDPARGWRERLKQAFARLVTVRKPGAEPQAGPDTALWLAQQALAQGKLPDALSELHTLPEPAQALLREWFAKVERVMAIETAFADLYARLGTMDNAMVEAEPSPMPVPLPPLPETPVSEPVIPEPTVPDPLAVAPPDGE